MWQEEIIRRSKYGVLVLVEVYDYYLYGYVCVVVSRYARYAYDNGGNEVL
jgi:hypothetical protein